MNSTVSDEALLAGLAAGQPEAAAAFIRRFQSRVYGLAITIVRDEGIAEDVAQETFTRAGRPGTVSRGPGGRERATTPAAAAWSPGSCRSPATWPSTWCV